MIEVIEEARTSVGVEDSSRSKAFCDGFQQNVNRIPDVVLLADGIWCGVVMANGLKMNWLTRSRVCQRGSLALPLSPVGCGGIISKGTTTGMLE